MTKIDNHSEIMKVFTNPENFKGSIQKNLTISEKEIDIVRLRLKSFKTEGEFLCMICLAGIYA